MQPENYDALSASFIKAYFPLKGHTRSQHNIGMSRGWGADTTLGETPQKTTYMRGSYDDYEGLDPAVNEQVNREANDHAKLFYGPITPEQELFVNTNRGLGPGEGLVLGPSATKSSGSSLDTNAGEFEMFKKFMREKNLPRMQSGEMEGNAFSSKSGRGKGSRAKSAVVFPQEPVAYEEVVDRTRYKKGRRSVFDGE